MNQKFHSFGNNSKMNKKVKFSNTVGVYRSWLYRS